MLIEDCIKCVYIYEMCKKLRRHEKTSNGNKKWSRWPMWRCLCDKCLYLDWWDVAIR